MNRPKLFKALRISWTVGWGLLVVLLIVLWVRSYWWCDHVNISTMGTTGVRSFDGLISFVYSSRGTDTEFISIPAYEMWGLGATPKRRNWVLDSSGIGVAIRCPSWFAVLTCITFAAIPWLRFQFSLRTLLIAITLVSIALGTIIALSR